ncbi:MAG: LuxR C-terminal-related transcriptional regulator [Litorivicinus sp.]
MKVVGCTQDSRLNSKWTQALQPVTDVFATRDIAALEAYLQATTPDLILFHMDGDQHRIDEAVSLIIAHENVQVLVLDDLPADENGIVLLKAGVRGYANAQTEARLLQTAVQAIARGEVWVSRRLMRLLVEDLVDRNGYNAGDNSRLESLTDREREVAEVVAEGASNKVVASRLNVTERTVKAHLTAAFQKTGTRDRLELALLVKGQLPTQGLSHGLSRG